MGIDAYILFERRDGVSRAAIQDALDVDDADAIKWHAGRAFSVFTGVRFRSWQDSDEERRIGLTLAQVSATLFDLIEPHAIIWPDVAEYGDEDSVADIEDEGAIRVPFRDYRPGDERLVRAAEAEEAEIFESVNAMMAFNKYREEHPDFAAKLAQLGKARDLSGLIALTQSVPKLAPLCEALVRGKYFETFILA